MSVGRTQLRVPICLAAASGLGNQTRRNWLRVRYDLETKEATLGMILHGRKGVMAINRKNWFSGKNPQMYKCTFTSEKDNTCCSSGKEDVYKCTSAIQTEMRGKPYFQSVIWESQSLGTFCTIETHNEEKRGDLQICFVHFPPVWRICLSEVFVNRL